MEAIEHLRQHHRVVPLGDVDLSLYDVGEGPAVLFIHGVFMNGLLWSRVAEPLSASRRCLAVDLPAHGESLASDDQDLSLTAIADLLAALLDELEIESVDVVANDTGGAVAQIFAVRHTERVRTLTLTNCDAHDNLPPEAFKAGKELAEQGDLAPLIRSLGEDPEASRGIPGLGMGFADTVALTDEEVESLGLAVFARPGRAESLERFVCATHVDDLLAVEDGLGRLETPTLIVWGTDDLFFELDWAHWLNNHIPGAQGVVEVPGGRLFFPYEHAEQLVSALSDFLGARSPVGAATAGGEDR